MKFSYKLLKQIAPGIKNKSALIESLNLHAFEAENGNSGDTVEIAIPANRYSDAASHIGVGRIAAAIFGGEYNEIAQEKISKKIKSNQFNVVISDKKICPRYSGMYVEGDLGGSQKSFKSNFKNNLARPLGALHSPKWMQDVLKTCGIRPINAVVDIMNYVMLEVGQPMHAFDADMVSGNIEVRLAKQGEKIETIDGEEYELSSKDIVIADNKGPLAIAGIKGGSRAAVNDHTNRLIVESASFDPVSIYKTSRRLGLITDASIRFSHGITPYLVEIGIRRAARLLKEICSAKIGDWLDIGTYKPQKRVLRFHIDKFNALTGLKLKESVALDYLKKLGFTTKGSQVGIPPNRTDISLHEDLVEEIVNLYGYENIPSQAPHIGIQPSGYENIITLKDEIRSLLRGFGASEVYTYSFVSEEAMKNYASLKWWKAVALENPISAEFSHLRPSLSINLIKAASHNLKFRDNVKIFELGKVFLDDEKFKEELRLGIVFADKNTSPVLELKGVVDDLLRKLGLTDFFMREASYDVKFLAVDQQLYIESDHSIIGCLGIERNESNIAVAELNVDKLLKLVEEERSYEPIIKYPAVSRDLSLFVPQDIRIGDLLIRIQQAAPKYLYDVDMIDFYQPRAEMLPDRRQRDVIRDQDKTFDAVERKSVTFRLVFQANNKTLTDEEVDKEMAKIENALREMDVEIR